MSTGAGRPQSSSQRAVRWLAVVLLLAAAPAAAEVRKAALGGGIWAVLQNSTQLFAEAQAQSGEGLTAFAKRLTGRPETAPRIARANAGATKLRPGLRYLVPFDLLKADLRAPALHALFPSDRAEATGWRHRSQGEALWHVALWFTGRGENFPALRKENRLRDDDLRWGQTVLVPAALLEPALRPRGPAAMRAESAREEQRQRVADAVPAAAPALVLPVIAPLGPPAPEPVRRPVTDQEPTAEPPVEAMGPPAPAAAPAGVESTTASGEPGGTHRLTYGRDAQGDYAIYALRGGEALYSSVVVRFTGRTLADDVNGLAGEIARRSGIDDVTSIPIGYEVKIPLDLLQPEFLPAGHPRRLEYEAAQNATRKFKNQVTALDLEGISVVLDAGHGGVDTGAMFGGVWESTYVYDIALRIKRLLESETAARVVPTTRDGHEFRIDERDVLGFSRSRAVLTSPPYAIEDSKVGVNLRWYLANSVERAVLHGGGTADKVVFLSIHADSLHPSLRGATVYIPDAQMSGDAFERGGPEYAARREVRENPSAEVTLRERQRSEGLSRDLGEHIIEGFRAQRLEVDPYKAVREHVIRRGRAWVPAVLRYNAVPAKALVEVCNLGNAEDRALIQTRAFRQRVAEAVVRGIRAYYGKSKAPPAPASQVAKAAAKR